MPRILKQGRSAKARIEDLTKVRQTVERVLDDIGSRGDLAVRELSVKFDGWDREDYRLTNDEIQSCVSKLSKRIWTTSSSRKRRCETSRNSNEIR
jgi:sulfopropanediol 3-dehydrogenase